MGELPAQARGCDLSPCGRSPVHPSTPGFGFFEVGNNFQESPVSEEVYGAGTPALPVRLPGPQEEPCFELHGAGAAGVGGVPGAAECGRVAGRLLPQPLAKLLHHTPHLPSEHECVSFFFFHENNTEQSLTFKNAMIFCHRYENLSAPYLIFWRIEYQNKRY